MFEQRSPPPPPPPPLLNSAHPVPTQNPMPFSQPGPAFNQQGQQPVFPRERPVRPNMQPQGPVGILHFNQPASPSPRPFIPPRQQFLQAPGQPFLAAHTQPSMQVRLCGYRTPRTPPTPLDPRPRRRRVSGGAGAPSAARLPSAEGSRGFPAKWGGSSTAA